MKRTFPLFLALAMFAMACRFSGGSARPTVQPVGASPTFSAGSTLPAPPAAPAPDFTAQSIQVGAPAVNYANVEFTADSQYMVWFEMGDRQGNGVVWHCGVDPDTGDLIPADGKGFRAFESTIYGRANPGMDAQGVYYVGMDRQGKMLLVRPDGPDGGKITELPIPSDLTRRAIYPTTLPGDANGYVLWIKNEQVAGGGTDPRNAWVELQYVSLADPAQVHVIERQARPRRGFAPMDVAFARWMKGKPVLTYGFEDAQGRVQVRAFDASRPELASQDVTNDAGSKVDPYPLVFDGREVLIPGIDAEARSNVYQRAPGETWFQPVETILPGASALKQPGLAQSHEPIIFDGQLYTVYQINERGNSFWDVAFGKPGEIWLSTVFQEPQQQWLLSDSNSPKAEPEPYVGTSRVWVFYNVIDGDDPLAARWQLFRAEMPPGMSPVAGPGAATEVAPGGAAGETVSTQWGPLRGVAQDGRRAYLGIPYAAPPLGDLRFRPPAPPQLWQQTLPADQFAPACPQSDEEQTSEDCLYLNVWTPADASPSDSLPVMVYIHGGGNVQGSAIKERGGVRLYDGGELAKRGGVVVVTLQYRIGALGFLAHPALAAESARNAAGNYGLLDQIAALQWVQANITSFGGDPQRVLLFGESGGAVDTCMLLASPLANGLFSRALMESGACVAKSAAERMQEGEAFARSTGCEDAGDAAACLRSLDVKQILAAVDTKPIRGGVVTMAFGPSVDGYVLPQAPLDLLESGQFNHVPLIVGSNADEMLPMALPMTQNIFDAAVRKSLDPVQAGLADEALALYPVGKAAGEFSSPQQAFAALISDAQFTCTARATLRAAGRGAPDTPVYRYFFSQRLDSPLYRWMGASHGLELFYVFQHLEAMQGYRPGPDDLALQAALLGYWTRFAAGGDPNGEGAVPWPVYEPQNDPYLEFGPAIQAGAGLFSERCDFWDRVAGLRQVEFQP